MTPQSEMITKKIYALAEKTWGKEEQFLKTLEELGELTAILARYLCTNRVDLREIITELADVRIMVEQVQFLLDIDTEVDAERLKKLERLSKKLGYQPEKAEGEA